MLFQEVFLKYTWSSYDRMVSPEISCSTKNEKQAQESVWEHVDPTCTWAWATSQAGSGGTLLSSSQKNTSAEKENLFEAVEGKCPCLGTAHLQEQVKRKDSARERHWRRARLLLYGLSVPTQGERQILIFFCQQALTKISLSIWPIMKEVSKTSVSRHECPIFFSGEKNPKAACLEFAPGVHRAEVLPNTLQF